LHLHEQTIDLLGVAHLAGGLEHGDGVGELVACTEALGIVEQALIGSALALLTGFLGNKGRRGDSLPLLGEPGSGGLQLALALLTQLAFAASNRLGGAGLGLGSGF